MKNETSTKKIKPTTSHAQHPHKESSFHPQRIFEWIVYSVQLIFPTDFLFTVYALPVGRLWTVYAVHIIAPMGYSYLQFMPIISFS